MKFYIEGAYEGQPFNVTLDEPSIDVVMQRVQLIRAVIQHVHAPDGLSEWAVDRISKKPTRKVIYLEVQ